MTDEQDEIGAAEPGEEPEHKQVAMAEFLEEQPPNVVCLVTDLWIRPKDATGFRAQASAPDLQLHCDAECAGVRTFTSVTSTQDILVGEIDLYLKYYCRNCRRSTKVFAFWGQRTSQHENSGFAAKYGERPEYGPPVPSRAVSLVGPARTLFLKGRRAENHGLGIGAMAYYRRVVEDQWRRFIDEMLRVAERTHDAAATEALKKAAAETRFTAAVESVRDAIPSGLLIEGHNPLTLLHKALSDALHVRTDEESLELAATIRIVLYELADRATALLRDHAELKGAISRLMKRAPNEGESEQGAGA